MRLLPSVYDYKDYRLFLADFYKLRKAEEKGYTYQRFSVEGGLASPNSLKMVMDGKRNLTNSSLFSFALALRLSGPEKNYFFHLVHFNQAVGAEEKRFFSSRLKELRPPRKSLVAKASSRSMLYDDIFTTIVACLVQGKPKGGETSLAEKELGLPPAAAKSQIERLTGSGLLREESGVWAINLNHVVFREKTYSVVLKAFLESQMRLSLCALRAEGSQRSKFVSHVMSIDPAEQESIQREVDDFVAGLNNRFEKSSGRPYQLNLQGFLVDKPTVQAFLKGQPKSP
jgi:uncharacterized protein (TIGR02147 family)